MPATAGRVKMPHNNRMHTSGALATNKMWANVIGHNPYASKEELAALEEKQAERDAKATHFQNLMEVAQLSGHTAYAQNRGTCKRCGQMGHLAFQCRNHLSLGREELADVETSSSSDDDDEVKRDDVSDVSSVHTSDLSELASGDEGGTAARRSKEGEARKGRSRKRDREREGSRKRSRKGKREGHRSRERSRSRSRERSRKRGKEKKRRKEKKHKDRDHKERKKKRERRDRERDDVRMVQT
eukprot:CAMPEP_0196781336 /NCGR_PEP_ID=MMETSP1104-20130614/9556_1 /TAXON_ID=33652 /ORGANISM="Cafeteria sp., Strain Caron Lab Isolate" /LENGTH=241 /DNA_ID=CAMNT_0042151565 /DNA_START=24 /DNA_END=746 /DNA_ORIENTATION=-